MNAPGMRLEKADVRIPDRMLAETRRYQMGSDGCAPVAMLLDNRRSQVRSDGCAPHRMLL